MKEHSIHSCVAIILLTTLVCRRRRRRLRICILMNEHFCIGCIGKYADGDDTGVDQRKACHYQRFPRPFCRLPGSEIFH